MFLRVTKFGSIYEMCMNKFDSYIKELYKNMIVQSLEICIFLFLIIFFSLITKTILEYNSA